MGKTLILLWLQMLYLDGTGKPEKPIRVIQSTLLQTNSPMTSRPPLQWQIIPLEHL